MIPVNKLINRANMIILSFAIPFFLMIAVMIRFGIQPFGHQSLVIVDGLHQYMPFFSVLYDKLKSGDTLFYSFRAGLGINFLALFAYYLSSPLNLLILLFPKTMLNGAVSILICLKIALSGLTAGIYFSSRVQRQSLTVPAAACAYALGSFMVGYSWNVMWLDAILIFPIIVLGIERLVDQKDGRVYCLALFYALLCNYYIAFMICIFSVIWFFTLHFKRFKDFFASGVAFAWYSLLSGGMAAIILIPAYLGIRQTAAGGDFSLPEHSFLTGLQDLVNRQFAFSTPISHDNFDGNANLYVGAFAVLAAFLYFLNQRISLGDKIKRLLIIALFYLSFSETVLNFIWHGFHDQYGIPNRFSFLLGFVLLTMFVDCFDHEQGIKNWHVGIACLASVGLMAWARQKGTDPLDDSVYGIMGMLLLLYGMLLFLQILSPKRRMWYRAVFMFTIIVEMCSTSVVGFAYNGQIDVNKFFSGTKDGYRAARELDDGTFFRSDMAGTLMVDEATWYPLRTVGLFGSTAPAGMVNAMDSIGFYTGCNEYLYRGATPMTNLLLGVRYLYFHPEDKLKTDFEEAGSFGQFRVTQNKNPVSVGFLADDTILDWDNSSAYPFRVLNELGLSGFGYSDIFVDQTVDDPQTNLCTVERTNDGEYYFELESADTDNIVFTLTADRTSERYFLHYDGTQVENAEISVNEEIVYSGDYDGRIMPIGKIEKDDVITVRMQMKEEDMSGYVRLSAACLDEEMYGAFEMEFVEERLFQIQSFTERSFEGTVVADEDQILMFSIPYDAGWKVLVDGKETKTKKIVDAFLAVPLGEGAHKISMSYTPEGFSLGWKLSLLCLLLFAGSCCLTVRMKKARKKRLDDYINTVTNGEGLPMDPTETHQMGTVTPHDRSELNSPLKRKAGPESDDLN